MRIKLLCCLMVFLLALPVAALPPKDYVAPSVAITDNTPLYDINRILMFVTNHGNFGRDLGGVFGNDYGTWWPFAGDTAKISANAGSAADFTPNYAAGLWIGALVEVYDTITTDPLVVDTTMQRRVAISEYASEYVPGPMVGGTFVPDNRTFRVYKLFKDSLATNPNQDYLDYIQYAIPEQGAPFVVTEDNDTIPDMIGDEMLWCVYNDADPSGHSGTSGNTPPLGIEVKQTVFGFDYLGSLGDMVFIKYQIFNKGGNNLEECYLSIWYDPDLGNSGDDLIGCDTLTDLGYCYNYENSDTKYGTAPPAIACDFFQGPLEFTGDDADTAKMWGLEWPQYTNRGLASFNKYINGTDPENYTEVYNYMRGLTKEGDPYVYDGQTLLFQCSGDPVTGEGDVDSDAEDRRWMQTTGPITFAAGDSTEILIAMMVSRGATNLGSVTAVKNLDVFAQKLYEEGFNPPPPPAKPVVTVARLSGEITLSWGDTSEVDPGEFPFEGYTVWQGEGPAGPWQLLETYDLINDREDAVNPLVDSLFDPETGLILPVVMRSIKNSGLKYHYRTRMDAITNSTLKDLSSYYFRVSAFSYGLQKRNGDVVPNGDRFLESATSVTVIPQAPLAGVNPVVESQDILPVVHAAGVSDGVIEPIVVDPTKLTGHVYRITFSDGWGVVPDTVWNLDTLLTDTCDWFQDDSTVIDDLVDPPETTEVVYWVPINCVETTLVEVLMDSSVIPVWHLYDTTAGEYVIDSFPNQSDNDDYWVVDGILLRVMGPQPGFRAFEVVENAGGVIAPPEPGAFWFAGFPVPTEWDEEGYISERQQVFGDGDHGYWGIHTGDNGGTCGGGTRGSYDAFLARALRPELDYAAKVGINDFEIRFTGTYDDPEVNGSWAYDFTDEDATFWVPFEIWHIGAGTPDDPSDDVRMLPRVLDWGENDVFDLESWGCVLNPTYGASGEHSVSGGDNDPYTDWFYWRYPINNAPGEAGYLEYETLLRSGDFEGADALGPFPDNEYMARMVFVSWNGGSEPPFVQDLPEQGTVFRMTTFKPNSPSDTFYYMAPSPLLTARQSDLDLIKAVPNPFYLYGRYDPNPGSYAIKFHHLPEKCTITIYNLAGELVRKIEKDDPTTAEATWDVLTANLLPVASGIYIYVVDAPGFGQKVGKMAVFVQQEVLKIY